MDDQSTSVLETTLTSLDGSFHLSHEVVLTSTPIKATKGTKTENYLCDICALGYVTLEGLKYHKASKHGIDAKLCKECNKSFRRQSDLDLHWAKAHGPKIKFPFACTRCEKAYGHKRNLLRHMQGCKRPDAFKCKTCLKSLSNKESLLTHEKAHEKAFMCRCGKVYSYASTLKEHMKTHG